MRLPSMASLALAFFAALASADAQERISVRGPADVLERLSDFREAVARWHPDLDVEWSGDEGGASFGELFDGSVDLLVSTRALSPSEQALARRLSLEIHENVAGLDAVAVVVHPDNFVESLTRDELRTLFVGKIVGWYGFGGSDRVVRLLAPVPWSGEYQALALLPGAQFRVSPAADLVPSPSAVLAQVASDVRAVGLVSMILDRSSVRTVPLKGDDEGTAILPTPDAVERGEYPLSRPLWLYSRGNADEGLRRVLSCWLSSDGQAEIAKAGFAAVTADRAFQRTLPAREKPRGATVTRVTFGAGAARLDREAERALTEVSNGAAEVWITGHAQLEEDRASGNRLSEARARAVGEFLRARAVTVAGAEAMVSLDRRVEVWWLSRR